MNRYEIQQNAAYVRELSGCLEWLPTLLLPGPPSSSRDSRVLRYDALLAVTAHCRFAVCRESHGPGLCCVDRWNRDLCLQLPCNGDNRGWTWLSERPASRVAHSPLAGGRAGLLGVAVPLPRAPSIHLTAWRSVGYGQRERENGDANLLSRGTGLWIDGQP